MADYKPLNIDQGGTSANNAVDARTNLGAEAISNKVQDFSTINNTLYPTTQAVVDYLTSEYDNYQYWTLSVDGTVQENINSNSVLDIIAGTGVTLDYLATGELTINSTAQGETNLDYTTSPANGVVTSDTGTNAIIPPATTTYAGLLLPSEKTRIVDSLQPGDNISELTNDVGYITNAEVTTPTLQSVTDEGNISTNSIEVLEIEAETGIFAPNSPVGATLVARGNNGTTALTVSGEGDVYNQHKGFKNTVYGLDALVNGSPSGGTDNTAIGQFAGYSLGNGSEYNTALGVAALGNASTSSDSFNNTAIGTRTLGNIGGGGNNNTALGYDAGTRNVSGKNNLYLGFEAGSNITTGNYNVYVGAIQGTNSNTSNEIRIADGEGNIIFDVDDASIGLVEMPNVTIADLDATGGKKIPTKEWVLANSGGNNVQSDWGETDNNSDAYILNKPTIPTNNNQLTNGAGYITDYTVTEADVTQHESAITITESQISDLTTVENTSDLVNDGSDGTKKYIEQGTDSNQDIDNISTVTLTQYEALTPDSETIYLLDKPNDHNITPHLNYNVFKRSTNSNIYEIESGDIVEGIVTDINDDEYMMKIGIYQTGSVNSLESYDVKDSYKI